MQSAPTAADSTVALATSEGADPHALAAAPAATLQHARLLTLQGGCNFRDIGGYAAQGGSVRWGQVYRTGVLSYLTSEDHGMLTALRVQAICDLRRHEEREREPTLWPHGSA